MKSKTIRFLIGLICFGAFDLLVIGLIFISNFDLYSCGNDILDDRLEMNIILILLIGLTFIQFFLGKALLKTKEGKPYGQAGWLLIPPLLAIAFNFSNGVLRSNYYTDFNKTEWSDINNRSIKMVRTIVNNEMLLKLNRQEVEELLGKPNYIRDETIYTYNTTHEALDIFFKNDNVSDIRIQCWD